MRLAWATDIHVDFLSPSGVDRFCRSLAATKADAFVITGDIANGERIEAALSQIACEVGREVARSVYFCLGNHDFYGSSVASVRHGVAWCVAHSAALKWLNSAGIVQLTAATALVGHDGWADGRAGSWERSTVRLNDYRLIAELSGVDQRTRLARMQALAAEAAAHFRAVLPTALKAYPNVLVATHVPPFAEACWHEGKISDDNWLPHFTSVAVGEVLREAAQEFPDRRITVLCGHTHSSGVARILPNLVVKTGAAAYGSPTVQEIIEVA